MPSVTAIHTNWTAGEISPRLYGRIDVERYAAGAHRIENMVVQRFGGVRKRGGSQYINEVKTSSTKVRLIPFVYSVVQAYIIEFGDNYARFYANGAVVESGGSPVEIATPYGEDDLADIQYAQSADVLYLAHPDYAPRQLTRTSATAFTIAEIDFEDGPYLELNTTSTTLTPADYASLTPKMTSNTAPSGTASDNLSHSDAYKAFDKAEGTYVTVAAASSGALKYQTAGSEQVIVDRYWITAASGQTVSGAPTAWKLQGSNDGTNWITIDQRSNETGWARGETRFYEFENRAAFEYHSLTYSAVDNTAPNFTVAELAMNRAPASQTAFNLTASAVTGINDDTGFQSTDVGRHIRLQGSDGVWRWAKIIARTSTTVVTVKITGHALPSLDPIINWRMGAWSDETGWPGSVSFHEGRLCFARTATQPETVWESVVDDFTNHAISSPLVADDAISAPIRAESLNEIKWLAEGSDLIVGTSGSIRTIGPATNSEPYSPTNIKQRRQTTFGAKAIRPVLIGNVGIYADYHGTALREFAYSFEADGYTSPDLSILAEHLVSGGVKEMAFTQNPEAVVWYADDAGNLRAMTYERDQNVVAFHRHTLAGTGMTVESVASIPGSGRDELWLVVKRTVNGGTKRYVERLSQGIADDGVLTSATFLDSHLTYSGGSTTTITGLDHLEGESVKVWDGTQTQGPYTVSSGSITVGSAVTWACAGLSYTSTLETLSPETGARGGTAQTRLGGTWEVFLRLDRSMGGSVGPALGSLETIDYALMENEAGAYWTSGMFTGDVRVPIDMGWERYKRVKIEHTDPTPFHVVAAIFEHRVTG